MTAGRKLALFAPAAVLAVAVAAGAVFMWEGAPAPAAAIGGPFTLTDGARTVTDRDFRGKWMLVYFGYTHCPDACPTSLTDMANAYDMLDPAAKSTVAMLFITVDPERDNPAAMKDYVASFDAPILGLSGTPEQIRAAEQAYRVYAAKHPEKDGEYSMDHSSIIYVMDPAGRFVANFDQESPPERIAAKMKSLAG